MTEDDIEGSQRPDAIHIVQVQALRAGGRSALFSAFV
jgi:hypothetical protein